MIGSAVVANFAPMNARRGRTPKALTNPIFPNRLQALRVARGASQQQLGEIMGTDFSMAGKLERGIHELRMSHLAAVARAWRIEIRDILPPDPAIVVNVIGQLGADGAVQPFRGAAMKRVECPTGLDASRVQAVEVQENALFPIDNGTLLFFERVAGGATSSAVGKMCAVRQHQAAPLILGQLREGSPGRYSVLGRIGPIIENAAIESAAPVRAMVTAELARWVPDEPFRLDTDRSDHQTLREAAETRAEYAHRVGRSR